MEIDPHRTLLHDQALLPEDPPAAGAIVALLQAGEQAIPLAGVILLLTAPAWQTHNRYSDPERDRQIWQVVEALRGHGHGPLALAVARWLALRPGYACRLRACTGLAEAGEQQMAIAALRILACECHGSTCLEACLHLTALGAGEQAAPLLQWLAQHAEPALRARAGLALAMTGHCPAGPDRVALKVGILPEREQAYSEAVRLLLLEGSAALRACPAGEADERAALALALFSLQEWAGALDPARKALQIDEFMAGPLPVVSLHGARLALGAGRAEAAQACLAALVMQDDPLPSAPVRRQALALLERLRGPQSVTAAIHALTSREAEIRWRAACALYKLADAAAAAALAHAASDTDYRVRQSALAALGMTGDPSLIPVLMMALRDGQGAFAAEALRGIVRAAGAATLPSLLPGLQDEAACVRQAVAQALRGLDGPGAIPALLGALDDSEERVRLAAAQALARAGHKAALPVLSALLAEGRTHTRAQAVEAIGQLGDAAGLPALLAALRDSSRTVRDAAAEAIVALGEHALPGLIAMLTDANPRVRRQAVRTLGALRVPAAAPALLNALRDEEAAVRRDAVWALATLRPAEGLLALAGALRDQDGEVCGAAAEALGEWGDPAAVTALAVALCEGHPAARKQAAEALGRTGDRAAVPHLAAALADADPAVQRAAADALQALGDPAGLPALAAWQAAGGELRRALLSPNPGDPAAMSRLLEALGDEESTVRSQAAAALGALGCTEALTALQAALNDSSTMVRISAVTALGRLAGPAARQALEKVLAGDAPVAQAAAEALGRLADPEALPALRSAMASDDLDLRLAAVKGIARLGTSQRDADGCGRGESSVSPGALERVRLVQSTYAPGDHIAAEAHLLALVHLEPQAALPRLDEYAALFGWIPAVLRLRGQALWRLGRDAEALQSLAQAAETPAPDAARSLLALAHFYLEHGDLPLAARHTRLALTQELYQQAHRAEGHLTWAVLLWQQGEGAAALAALSRARRWHPGIDNPSDLRYERFWGPRALAALAELASLCDMSTAPASFRAIAG